MKLTVAGYWSWWRVMLPFLAFLGHYAVYLLAGFLWLLLAEVMIAANRRESAGHSWEIYGDPTPNLADTETTVVYLLK